MKSKPMTYLLGGLVLMIWGTIVYRIVLGMQADDDVVMPIAAKVDKAPYDDYSLTPDTSKLLLNYRDPFGLKSVIKSDTVKIARRASATKVAGPSISQPPTINWESIKYSGYIRNPETKRLIALVSVMGKSVMLQEGETQESLKLLKNLKDSIKINYRGITRYLHLN